MPKPPKPNEVDDELEILIDEFNDLANDIQETSALGRASSTDTSKMGLFRGRLSRLDSTHDKFLLKYSEIWRLARTAGKDMQEYKDLKDKTRKHFYEALSFDVLPGKSDESNNGDTSLRERSSRESSFHLRLPVIHIPAFSGNISDWPSFRDTFVSLIHDNEELSDVQKFHYLKSNLKGSAAQTIAAIQITEQGYTTAWDALTKRFNSLRLQATYHLVNIFNFPAQTKHSLSSLENLSSSVLESASAFRKLKLDDPSGFILYTYILRLLDSRTRERFEMTFSTKAELPTWDDFVEFIAQQMVELQSANLTSTNKALYSDNKLGKGPKQVLMTNAKAEHVVCPICNSTHRLIDCSTFRNMSPKRRFDQVKVFNRCVNCFGLGHSAAKCPSKHSCKQCSLRHHTMLHFPTDARSKNHSQKGLKPSCSQSNSPNTNHPSNKNETSPRASHQPSQLQSEANVIRSDSIPPNRTAILSSSTSDNLNVLLGTAQARIKDNFGQCHQLRILVDSGSQRSFITTKLANQLGLSKIRNSQLLVGFSNHPIAGGKYQVPCIIVPQTEDLPQLSTMAIVIDQISADMPSVPIPQQVMDKFEHLKLADTACHTPGPIDFLLGADLFGDVLLGETINTDDGLPNAFNTVFGWVLLGPISNASSISACRTMLTVAEPQLENETLPAIMSRFWEIEEVATVNRLSPDDIEAEKHFESTHTRNEHGRYIVRLPFKGEPPNLESSKFMAIHRFRKLEEKLTKTGALRLEYNTVFQDYLDQHYLSLTTQPGKYFLPHHGVCKDSSSTHLRIVFDASASTSSGSLNSHLITGPKLQHDIRDILLKFRIPQYVVSADICKMFLQILIDPEDRVYHHLFFRFNPDDAIEQYEFNRLPFGLSCSPFLAIRVIQQLVSDEGHNYPLASRALLNNMYIDDLLTGSDTLDEALKLQNELVDLLSKGGFTLKKWCSNEPQLVKNVSSEGVESTVSLCNMEDTTIKILGMQWEPNKDRLSYRFTPKDMVFTKRGIMSSIARMYDPLGYLSPVIFRAKTILQQLWRLKIGWDDPVPSDIRTHWELFSNDLNKLSQISIPRRVCSSRLVSSTIVGFADASSQGYAAVVYLRTETESGDISTNLILAKTRLAPLKPLTIPRLELCAAVLLVEILKALQEFLSHWRDAPIYLLSDSATVLAWLKLPFHKMKTFVAHRVAKIMDLSQIESWHHIRSHYNAADGPSRGRDPVDLINDSSWWFGPDWIRLPISDWPLTENTVPNISQLPEIKPDVSIMLAKNEDGTKMIDGINKFSSFTKLIRVFSYVRRFCANSKASPNERRVGSLKLIELKDSTTALIKLIQNHYFPKADKSDQLTLQSLSPFVDSVGVLRVGGRLRHAPLSDDAKYPILLPRKAHFVTLLVDHYHISYLHAGPHLLQSLLRRKFWILSGRRLIRQRVHQCLRCHQLSTKNFTYRMANLPVSRFEQGRPFLIVGVDFAGPFMLRESLRRKAATHKAYVALFVCLSTKAIHIEIVSHLTTEAFLAGLDRFIARRGLPSKIMSDHGTNFIGAHRRLKELFSWWNLQPVRQKIEEHLNTRGIEWSFIPPSAPHFGGIWEAGVKSLKFHLSRVVKDQILTFEEMTTVTIRIEAILNSRPLHPMSSSPEDLDVLTPGHFLIGAPLLALPEPNLCDIPSNRLTRWQLLRRSIADFWNRWRHDYLNCLQQRVKWTSNDPNISPGTLVLLKDANIPLSKWPKGRVIDVFPGDDGIVRVVKIKTSTGEYIRPVSKLAPLLPIIEQT